MNLFFFPAFLPLAPVVPALFTLISLVALFLRKKKLLLICVFTVLLSLGFWWQSSHSLREGEGSTQIPSDQFSVIERVDEADLRTEISSGSASFFSEVWSRLTSAKAYSSPASFGELLLVGTEEGTLEAYSKKDGKRRWRLKKKETIIAEPLIVEGVAYVGEGLHSSANSRLTAMDLSAEKVIWERNFVGHLETRPVLDGRDLWVVSGPTGLWKLDRSTGDVRLHLSLGHIDIPPVIDGDTLWVVSQPDPTQKDSALIQIHRFNGDEIKRVPLKGLPWGTPILDQRGGSKSLYVTASRGVLNESVDGDEGWAYRVDPESGKTLWKVELGGLALHESILLPNDGGLLHQLKSGVVILLDPETGKIRWRRALEGLVFAPPTLVLTTRGLYFTAVLRSGFLQLRSVTDGSVSYETKIPHDSYSKPVFESPFLYHFTPMSLVAYRLP